MSSAHHATCRAGRRARCKALHAGLCTLQDVSSCAVQELLDGYRETGVAYLDLSYFPTDALIEPGPAACVAGELKLVPGQFGMPSLVTCFPNPPSFHTPLCKQSMPVAHYDAQTVHDVRAFAPCKARGCRLHTYLSSLGSNAFFAKWTDIPAQAVHTDCRWCLHLQA